MFYVFVSAKLPWIYDRFSYRGNGFSGCMKDQEMDISVSFYVYFYNAIISCITMFLYGYLPICL